MRFTVFPATLATLAMLALAPLVGGCDDLCGDKECLFTTTEWDLAHTLSPLPEPMPDPTNDFVENEAAASLGHKLLYETRYSTALKVASTLGAVGDPGKVACASCHRRLDSWTAGRNPTICPSVSPGRFAMRPRW